MDIPEFSSLVENHVLDGDKIRIDDLLNKSIVITNYHISTSKFKSKGCGYCIKVQFYFADDTGEVRKVFFSGSGVIKDQLEEAKSNLEKQEQPLLFKATVKKVGNYYSLV